MLSSDARCASASHAASSRDGWAADYNGLVMPKRRPPGHLQRTGRRRRDRTPNVPPPPSERAVEPLGEETSVGAAAPASAARPLRPTLRGTSPAARFARSAQPALDAETEYRYILRDLRQIGVLALVAFVVLGVLAVVIH